MTGLICSDDSRCHSFHSRHSSTLLRVPANDKSSPHVPSLLHLCPALPDRPLDHTMVSSLQLPPPPFPATRGDERNPLIPALVIHVLCAFIASSAAGAACAATCSLTSVSRPFPPVTLVPI